MLRAPLLLALAPEPASAARDGDGSGAHAGCCRPDRRHAGQGAGEQPWRDAESGIPVTSMARSPVPYSQHAVPTVRGFPVRSLLVTAAGIPAAYAADLVRHMAGRYRPPDALRRADTLPRADPPAAMTARQPDGPGRRAECHERALPRAAATYI